MKNLDLTHIRTSGMHLIEASAGTGKTWTIAALYILLLLESRLRPAEILVVTYTKAATTELRDRIRGRINRTLELFAGGREPGDVLEQILLEKQSLDRDEAVRLLTRALYSFDDAAIYTIHGFCQRALQDNAFESGSLFDTEMITDQSSLVGQVCEDFWRKEILCGSGDLLEKLVSQGCTPDKLALPFKGHYQDPQLSIIPYTSDPDLTALIDRRDTLFPRLESAWTAEKTVIVGLLNTAGLNQGSYKPDQISKAASALEAWFAEGNLINDCAGLRLFSAATILKGTKKGMTTPTHPFFDLSREMHDTLEGLNRAFAEKMIHRQTALHAWMKQELPRRKRERNQRCFDDLLLDLHTALTSDNGPALAGSLRSRYRAALIDEFQDTDPLQWDIFRTICSEADYPLYLIGDPKQAIYSFRGADIYAYIAAARAVDDPYRSTLDTNRRSVKPLVDAVNGLFDADDPFLHTDISFNPVQSGREKRHNLLRNGEPITDPLRFWVCPREDQSQPLKKREACRAVVRSVAEEIARLLDGSGEIISKEGRRPLAAGDIAVLVKAHYQADMVQEALRELGIPSVQHGSSTIFESVEALDLLRILRAAADPARERLLSEALLTGTMGVSADRVAGYRENSGDDREWEEWLLRFRGLNGAAATKGIISLAERLLGECGVRRNALGQVGGERLLTNLLHCVELLHHAEQEQGLALEGLITWLERMISRKEEDDTALLRLETDANAVQLSTIHASKGLEYPVVFLPFAWDSPSKKFDQILFHDGDNRLTLDLGSDQLEDSKARAARERAAEAARLLYVAITRAEFLCYVAWGSMTDAHLTPLFRLLHGATVSDSKAFKSYPDENILADIRERGSSMPGMTAAMMPVDLAAPAYRPQREQVEPFTCRSLSHPVSADWRVSSFSSLTAGIEKIPQPRDCDALLAGSPRTPAEEPSSRPSDNSIYDFPRGAIAGTCLHNILQELDFPDLSDAHILKTSRTCLNASGYDNTWLPAVCRMISAVTAAPLVGDYPQFSLSKMLKVDWQAEMEFFLPVGELSPERLRQALEGLLTPQQHGHFGELLAALQFQQSRGMLHGFMDLVFQQDGRYYIIDWKSNHLGFDGSDYGHDGMTRSMAEHSYILQYHLYTLALNRYLKLHLPGYSYETHFGGAIYVFLRGVDAENPAQGIYRDKPAAAFIERAERLMLA
jgi:exodeoxyribonuclease V beta subunit